MLKYQIKSCCCCIIMLLSWLVPISSVEGIFIDFGAFSIILISSIVVGFFAYNGFIHAENKMARIRKKNIIHLNDYRVSEQKQSA